MTKKRKKGGRYTEMEGGNGRRGERVSSLLQRFGR